MIFSYNYYSNGNAHIPLLCIVCVEVNFELEIYEERKREILKLKNEIVRWNDSLDTTEFQIIHHKNDDVKRTKLRMN